MENIYIILNILQLLVFIYLGLATFYLFVFALASLFKHKLPKQQNRDNLKYAVLIPGYKEDQVIIDVAKESLKQNYPSELYDIIIIADSFKKETLAELNKLNVNIIEVSFERSTKSKSLNQALNLLPENVYDVAIVLDADNIMEKDFIKKINALFIPEIRVIQGHRIAKNTNTSFAILDAISEEMNNNIFRKGHRNLGFSSALIGSAMAFRYSYFKTMMEDINAVGGFDKQLELKIIKNRDKIEYHMEAFVLDEKIQNSQAFSNQRKRWISAQLYYFRKDFLISFWHFLSKGNLDYFNKAYQFIQPPRVLLLGLLFVITFASLLLNPFLYSLFWGGILLMCILSFFFTVPIRFYNIQTFKAFLSLPIGFCLMFITFFGFNKKKHQKSFIHTEHTATTKENTINKE
ncbi:MAG: glycosyltransferase [Bacteroidota bacterium]|nr:glycosyltransferase [Bacteroidota bacterium]